MAKNKKKNVKQKNKNGDDKLNLIVRENCGNFINLFVSELATSYPIPRIQEVIHQIKNIFYSMDKREVEGLMDDSYFMTIFNYIEEIFLGLEIQSKVDFTEMASYYKEKIVALHKDNNIKWELFIYINKVASLLENPKLYKNEKYNTNGDMLMIKAITDILYFFYHYCFTYVEKIKNKKFKGFVKDGNNVILEYENRVFAEPELIQSTYHAIHNSLPVSEKQKKLASSIVSEIHRHYANFISQKIMPEYYQETIGCLAYNGTPNLPIIFDKNHLITDEMLEKIPFGRKYAFPSSGVRFNFLNKEDGVDYIDMIENKESISLNLYLINDGNYYKTIVPSNVLNWVMSDEMKSAKSKTQNINKEKIFDKRIKMSFYLKKSDFKENENVYEKISHVIPIGFGPDMGNDDSYNLFILLSRLILSCVYCAYYDLTIFKDIVSLGTKEKTRKHTSSTRQPSLRVAHLRRLPAGQKASKDSLANAKKEGFEFIEEGYTFVRAFAPKKNEVKVINIK